MFPIQALKMRNPSTSGGGTTPPTPPTATYAYDYTERPWSSWATDPTALYDATSNKTYVAWEAQCQFRHIKIAAYDHSAGTWSTPVVIDSHDLDDDDHGIPAIELLSDGRLVCFYGSHNSNQMWSISGQSGGSPNINSWTRQTALSGNYAYPKPVNIGSSGGAGTLYLFMRKEVATSPQNSTFVLKTATYTSGGAVSLGTDTTLVNFDTGSGGRVYASHVRLNGSNIEFCASNADATDSLRQHVYYFRYIVSTGAVENLSAGVSTASGSLPITLSTANTSYREKTSSGSNGTGGVSWCRDSNGYLHIFYGDDTTDPFDLKHNWHNGTSWQGETTVCTVDAKGATGGSGGFVDDWCLVANGATVEAYYPANNNGGFTGRGGDDIARKIWNGSWGSEVLVLEGDEVNALGHPDPVTNAHDDFRVMFCEMSQDVILESRDTFKRYFLGDSGYLEWPAPSDVDAFKNILVLNFQGANNATSYSDESGWKNLHPITFNGNAKLDTATAPPWGTSWLKLDGTGDYLSVARSGQGVTADGGDWKLGVDDTIGFVFRLNATGRLQAILGTRTATNAGGFIVYVTASNTLQFAAFSAGSTVANIIGTTALTTGTTYKGAIKRTASGFDLRLNGVSEGTAAAATPAIGNADFIIGRDLSNTTRDFNGWIKQIRWTKLAGRDISVVPSADYPVA